MSTYARMYDQWALLRAIRPQRPQPDCPCCHGRAIDREHNADCPFCDGSGIDPHPYPAPAPAPRTLCLSYSQVSSWLHCSAAHWYKYSIGLPDPPTASLALGRAIHTAAAVTLRSRLDGDTLTAQDLTAAVLPGVLRDELDRAVLAPEDDPDAIQAQAQAMYTALHPHLAGLQPAAVEHELAGKIAGYTVTGVADVIASDGAIVDLKTSSRSPAGVTHAHSLQLGLYAHLARQDDTLPVAQAPTTQGRILTVTSAKTPKVVQHSTTLTPASLAHVSHLVSLVGEGIIGGLVVPNRLSRFCSRANCAFAARCEAEFGGTVNPG
jgi:hypothetical protein